MTQTALDYARAYLERGWQPIPVPFRSKKCVLDGWPTLRLTPAEVGAYFTGGAQNIGILNGAPSGGLIDIDLDCPEALAAAGTVLPATNATFGRASTPESHWLYRVDPPPRTKQFVDPLRPKEAGMLLE